MHMLKPSHFSLPCTRWCVFTWFGTGSCRVGLRSLVQYHNAAASSDIVHVQGLHSDLRAAVLLLLVARCKGNAAALSAAGGVNIFLALLRDGDVRICHIAAAFLQVNTYGLAHVPVRKTY